jgi:signal peptidase II
VNEPVRSPTRRPVDVRVGSATNALQPISSAERSLAAGRRQWLGLVAVCAAAIVADQVTKLVVVRTLALNEAVGIVGPFQIHHVKNTGIAFGLFSGRVPVVIFLTALVVGAMVMFFARSAQRHPLITVALGLVLGGSVSNLFDRVRYGYVTDFLDFDYWPAFNLADTFIVAGVGLLFLSLVAADRTSARLGSAPLSRL